MVKMLLIGLMGLGLFTGCANSELQVSKCVKYEKGVCLSTSSKKVYKCENPVKINGETYCDK